MDIESGAPQIMTKDARPKWTIWSDKEVAAKKRWFRRRQRRVYRQYMRTGRIEDFNRSQRKLSNWDFD